MRLLIICPKYYHIARWICVIFCQERIVDKNRKMGIGTSERGDQPYVRRFATDSLHGDCVKVIGLTHFP